MTLPKRLGAATLLVITTSALPTCTNTTSSMSTIGSDAGFATPSSTSSDLPTFFHNPNGSPDVSPDRASPVDGLSVPGSHTPNVVNTSPHAAALRACDGTTTVNALWASSSGSHNAIDATTDVKPWFTKHVFPVTALKRMSTLAMPSDTLASRSASAPPDTVATASPTAISPTVGTVVTVAASARPSAEAISQDGISSTTAAILSAIDDRPTTARSTNANANANASMTRGTPLEPGPTAAQPAQDQPTTGNVTSEPHIGNDTLSSEASSTATAPGATNTSQTPADPIVTSSQQTSGAGHTGTELADSNSTPLQPTTPTTPITPTRATRTKATTTTSFSNKDLPKMTAGAAVVVSSSGARSSSSRSSNHEMQILSHAGSLVWYCAAPVLVAVCASGLLGA